jgi:DNA-binding MarR family transcriptional regulator
VGVFSLRGLPEGDLRFERGAMRQGRSERGGERRVRGDARRASPRGDLDLEPALEVMEALWALDDALQSRERSAAETFGITRSQRVVMRIVGQRPGVSAGDLSRILHVHPSTLTPVLHRLVEGGLLGRAPDPIDRRRAVLRLSRRGKRIDTVCAARIDAVMSAALAHLPAGEVAAMRRVLTALAEALAERPPGASPREDAASP